MVTPARRTFVFGRYRLDPIERQLYREGELLPLSGKPFDVLVLLVERAGQLVTRDELLREVWQGAFVEDAVITVSVSALRKVLGDERRNGNRFIETIPRIGYRFVARVEEKPDALTSATERRAAAAPSVWAIKHRISRTSISIAAAILVAVAAGIIAWREREASSAFRREITYRQITANSTANPVARAAISPDGKFLAYTDLTGLHIRLIETGDTQLVAPPPQYCFR